MGIHPENVGTCATAAQAPCQSRNEQRHDSSGYNKNKDNTPRGIYGTTDQTSVFNLSATYRLDVFKNDLMFKATVYNLFNSSTETTVVQKELKQILQVILLQMLTGA